MNDVLQLVRELLDYVEDYSNNNTKTDIEGFSNFLQIKFPAIRILMKQTLKTENSVKKIMKITSDMQKLNFQLF